jgi:arabinose-5-phosphate isomerase
MTKKDILQTARDVLDTEARAVAGLAAKLDDAFVATVDLLARAKSRVIVIGMGKSGLVGRKMAATLASCGTPAVFIHPAEAGHGDLGIVQKNDVVIAISYSGQTREIVDLLDFLKRLGVRLVAITGNRNSRIGRFSDIVLDAGVEREAGPGGLIPTASSTAALALGDALAIAVMRRKGLDERAFGSTHPKGQLGRRALTVEALMHRGSKIPRVAATTRMKAAIEEMTAKKLGMTCVVDAGDRLLGIITDGDLRRLLRRHGGVLLAKTAGACMTTDPVTVSRNKLATEALNLMEERRITSLVIMEDDDRIGGVIHLHDLWRTEMF